MTYDDWERVWGALIILSFIVVIGFTVSGRDWS